MRTPRGQNQDPAKARVKTVSEDEVDHTVFAAKGKRRLHPIRRQCTQTIRASFSEDQRQRTLAHRLLTLIPARALGPRGRAAERA